MIEIGIAWAIGMLWWAFAEACRALIRKGALPWNPNRFLVVYTLGGWYVIAVVLAGQ